jgi:hypothetical protein
MRRRAQVVCTYQGYQRELCPVVLGWTDGHEKALTFQFGGGSKKGLKPGGEWRCLNLGEVTDVSLREGRWISGDSHQASQVCVKDVDLDVNSDSPFNPRRRLT